MGKETEARGDWYSPQLSNLSSPHFIFHTTSFIFVQFWLFHTPQPLPYLVKEVQTALSAF